MQSEAEIHNLFLAWLWDSFPGVMLVQCISTCTDCKDEITCLVYWRFLCDDSASGHTSAFYWCSAEILPQGSVLIILIKMLLWWGIKLVAVDTLMPLISFSYFDPLNGRKHLKICKRESNIKKYKSEFLNHCWPFKRYGFSFSSSYRLELRGLWRHKYSLLHWLAGVLSVHPELTQAPDSDVFVQGRSLSQWHWISLPLFVP